jgi:5-hydroxyisourate hydrolase
MIRGKSSMGKLTTHVLNIASGIPAAGMRVELRQLDRPALAPIIALTTAEGRCPAPLLEGAAFLAGRYALSFQVASYFRSIGVAVADPAFLDEVVVAFGVCDPAENHHVPLLVSPWSYSTYRGS